MKSIIYFYWINFT